ncbi:hypothetical protein, conserved [Babesia bigemina]|uniref:C3H1-type domain-containing protein n=1 Tax=Babesia bigemina TaxID=5866 RepID=A0A061BK91_BABBI|nr:hypothetical protein, conserved [Babesia bigemina]CDR71862.1 hypothetical protein, conserved [Babesia bigemina]|eukprot:XP_012770805.1 hypothetical protein, conserved [Babesia bigemina]
MTSINHYNNLRAIKDIDSKLISLGHLAGQLGGFVGQSEIVKKAVKNAIIVVINSNEELKNDLNDVYISLVTKLSESVNSAGQAVGTDVIEKLSQRVTQQIKLLEEQLKQPNNLYNLPSSPSPSAELAKLHSKLDALRKVEELCENYKNLKNASNNPKNLLDNLCDGLQTFLGYDKTSKGYDGQGIVYSDLDRLCDGVMGFLSGVLSNIYKHLGQHKETITSAITSLEANKHAGKKGFNDAIGEVVAGVGRYNDRVRESNENVKNAITTLSSNVEPIKKELQNDSASNSVEKINKQIETCLHHAERYVGAIKDANDHVNDLQGDLMNKLKSKTEIVKYQRKRLSQLYERQKSDFEEVTKLVGVQLNDAKESITTTVTQKINSFIDELTAIVRALIQKMSEINDTLSQHVERLHDWIEKSHKAVELTIRNVESIACEVGGSKTSHKDKLIESVKALEKKGLDLYKAYYASKDALPKLITAVSDAVTGLDAEIIKGLKTLSSEIKKQVEEYVEEAAVMLSEIQTEVGNKNKAGKNENGDSIDYNWDVLKFVINSFVEKIEGDERSRNYDGLRGIVRGFTEYVTETYADSNFGNTVEEWLKDILGSEPVKSKMKAYFDANSNNLSSKYSDYRSEITKNHISKIATSIRTALKSQIETAGQSFATKGSKDASDNDIVKSYKRLETGSAEFAAQLDTKVAKGDIHALISDIVEGVAADVLKDKGLHNNRTILKYAMDATVSALTSAAKNVSAQVAKLITTSNLHKNVHDAITKTNSIRNVINNTGTAGDKIQGALDLVKDKIEQLGTILTSKELGADIDIAMSNYFYSGDHGIRDKMTAYKSYVSKGGVLGNSIEAIRTNALMAFSKLNTTVDDKLIRRDLSNFHSHMQVFCNAILQAATASNECAKNKLEKLKEWISREKPHADGTLQKFKEDINRLQTDKLNPLMQQVQDIIIQSTSSSELIVEQLQQHVTQQLDDAKDTVIDSIRTKYISFMKSQLTEFIQKATAELDGIPEDINRDLTVGFKGFVKTSADGHTDADHRNGDIIKRFKELAGTIYQSTEYIPQHFAGMSLALMNCFTPIKNYMITEIDRVNTKNNNKGPVRQGSEASYAPTLKYIHHRFSAVCSHLKNEKRFDHEIPLMLDDLTSALSMLKPDGFSNPNSPLLDCIVAGLGAFAGELNKVYIPKYLGAEPIRQWLADAPKGGSEKTSEKNQTLTDDGRNCAKVFLTSLQILFADFYKLRNDYSAWNGEQIHLGKVVQHTKKGSKVIKTEYIANPLGTFFVERGYTVATSETKQDGELQRSDGMIGSNIRDLCYHQFGSLDATTKKLLDGYMESGGETLKLHKLLEYLYDSLHQYYDVCHLKHVPKPTTPSNVYQMLMWLTGLTHTAVYSELTVSGFSDLFEKRDAPKLQDDGESVSFGDDSSETLDAYPRPISAGNLSATLGEVCAYAEQVLIAILGHGHESGIYAVDFNTNPDHLLYPSTAGACLDMLSDILARVYHQCVFIYSQCRNSQYSSGWSDCLYGQRIGGSAWTCNTKQCANQNTDQTGDQTCNQNCKQHPKCGVKSPLQSFLEDGLPGFLPHSFTKPGCKWECTVSNHRGIPCKTPMGFRYLSQVASHVQTGAHLRKALADFCGTSSALTQLCGMLTCLTRQTPQTLGDLFAFYHGLLENFEQTKHKKSAFDAAVDAAYFGEHYEKLQVVSIQVTSDHVTSTSSVDDSGHLKGDLYTLVRCNRTSNPAYPCGPYLQSLTLQTRSMFSNKHAGNYLSWIVYLTETFYTLLDKLYKECCKKCATPGTRCCDKSCIKTCPVKYPAKPVNKELRSKKHSEDCNSIVKCPDTHPTLYKYGFTFGSPHELSGKKGDAKIRTCADFCSALERVLHKDSVLIALIKAIDEFLFDIRDKFFWTTVALWLLSFLYLLHIMVIRLDLLHIKSHLHSPSSHRIAAQSLLAAARVNKLGRVFYLQP